MTIYSVSRFLGHVAAATLVTCVLIVTGTYLLATSALKEQP